MKNTRKINLQLFAAPKETKIETKLEVNNEADSDVAELYLYGTIRRADPWEDEENCISAKRVLNVLKDIGTKDINIRINSGGGDVFESIAIHNTLKQHKGKVNIIIDSRAGSGASVIAMAGDTVKMFPTSTIMIHKAWTYVCGNADDLRKQADDLDKIDTSVKASYQDRFVGTDDELEKLISEETWLTAEECLTFGFCDEIIDKEKKDNSDEPQANIKENLFNKYKKSIQVNTKQSLFNKFKKTGGNE